MVEIAYISSRRNPAVRAAAALGDSPGARREKGLFLCEGARLCEDAALSGVEVRECFFTSSAREKYGEYLGPVLARCGSAYEVEPSVAELLSTTRHPQGVFCVCAVPQEREFLPGLPCLVLERLQDPGNLGTILRTAEALGRFQVFLLGDCCDPFSPKALRAGMGAVFRLGIFRRDSARKLGEELAGYTCLAAVPSPLARDVTTLDFTQGRYALMIGNEGGGLSEEAMGICREKVTIPMKGRAESLNAAAAATVLLWEMARGKGGEWKHG